MLIELFFVGFDEEDAIESSMPFDTEQGAREYNNDEHAGAANVYSATVGVNASDLTEVTE